MEEPVTPEEDLNRELHKQERDIHEDLFLIHQLYNICFDKNFSMSEIRQKSQPILNKLRKSNPVVVHEIEELLKSQKQKELLNYIEIEKQQLIQTLGDEMKKREQISKELNKQKNENLPTDS